MDNKAHVWFVNAHAKSNGSNHNLHQVAPEQEPVPLQIKEGPMPCAHPLPHQCRLPRNQQKGLQIIHVLALAVVPRQAVLWLIHWLQSIQKGAALSP